MNIAIRDISLKPEILWVTFLSQKVSVYLQPLLSFYPKATDIGEIKQNNGHYAVQGHSRSTMLVPIESSYVTFY